MVAIAGAVAARPRTPSTRNDPQAHAAGSTDTTAAQFGATAHWCPPSAAQGLAPPRTLSHADPLKLWVGGDSLAGSFGPALGDQVGATGVVKTVIDYKVSSGLWSNDIRNWYERATEQMAADESRRGRVHHRHQRHADRQPASTPTATAIPDWEAEYRMKVARMMDLLVGPHHRTVFWLGPPTLGTDSLDQRRQGDRRAHAPGGGEARARRHVPRHVQAVLGPRRRRTRGRILDENGKEILARISDGTHFTEDGAQYLARAVFKLIDARWNITKQADLQDPIGWTFADGNGELVPGFSARTQVAVPLVGQQRRSRRPATSTTPTTDGPARGHDRADAVAARPSRRRRSRRRRATDDHAQVDDAADHRPPHDRTDDDHTAVAARPRMRPPGGGLGIVRG